MASEKTVRLFFSTILFCMATYCAIGKAHAKEDELVQASFKEMAESYLENPTLIAQGNVYPVVPPCGNCGCCEGCECYCEEPYLLCPSDEIYVCPPGAEWNNPCCGSQMPCAPQSPPNQGQQPPPPLPPNRLSPSLQPAAPLYRRPNCGPQQEGYTVNYENISIIELIKFISKISGVNYIFDSTELVNPTTQNYYTVTLISEDPTQVSDLSAALLQILNMYGLAVAEQGNNVLIYKNQNLSKVSTVITENNVDDSCDNAVITRVFQLYNVDPVRIAAIVKTLASPSAVVDASIETRHLIVTDITANVNKIADLLSALDTPTLPVDVAEYNVKNADPANLAEYAQEILKPIAGPTPLSITPEPVSMKVFVVGTPVLINRAMQILASLDVPEISSLNPPPPSVDIENNNFFMYKLKYQDGLEIADALHDIGTNLQYTGVANIDFVNAVYTAQWLEVNNSIVITGTEDAIDKVVTLLDDLDQLPKQVYIEVLVLDTLLENSLDFGVQWIALGEEQNKLAFATGLLANGNTLQSSADAIASSNNPNTGMPPAIPSPANIALPVPNNLIGFTDIANATEAFSLGILGNILTHNGRSFLTLGALLSALDEQEDTKIVINPKIMVEDTQPANFFVGQNIPYQTTSTVIQQTGSVTQNIQYEDIGVQLQVTPTISPDNIVTLQINQTVATLAQPAGSTLTPTTNKELVTTRVHVPDGAFLVMSGHVQDICTYIHSGIPCLGSLPLIGPAFARNIEQRQKRNLIFFIRPKVVTNLEEGIILTNEEGYEYNWGSNPCSLIECECPQAPECETYPNPTWPPHYTTSPEGFGYPMECCVPQEQSVPPVEQPPKRKPAPARPFYQTNYPTPPPASPPPPPGPGPAPGYYPPYGPGPEVPPNYGPSMPPGGPNPYGGAYPPEAGNQNQGSPSDYLNYPYSENQLQNYPYTEFTPPSSRQQGSGQPPSDTIVPQNTGEFQQPPAQTSPNYIQANPGFTQPNSARAAQQPPFHSVFPSAGLPGTYPEYPDY